MGAFARGAPQNPLVVVPVSLFAFAVGCTFWSGLEALESEGDVLVAISGLIQAALVAYVAYVAAKMQMRPSLQDRAAKERDNRHSLERDLRKIARCSKSILEFLENTPGWIDSDVTTKAVLGHIRECGLTPTDVKSVEGLTGLEVDEFHEVNDLIDEINALLTKIGRMSEPPSNTGWRQELLTSCIVKTVALNTMAAKAYKRCQLLMKRAADDELSDDPPQLPPTTEFF